MQHQSKKIAKPPKKVPVRKQKAEDKKVTRKAKAVPKKVSKKVKQTPQEQPAEKAKPTVTTKTAAATETSADNPQKYYMNFDFYFKRTSFRTMTLYFKTLFKPFLEKWKAQKKNRDIKPILVEFMKTSFPGLYEALPSQAQFEFLELFKILVFSHRHNKNDFYLQDPLVSFEVVREPMYKYSKQAQERFFEHPTFAFLFLWFGSNPEALAFANQKNSENTDPRYPTRMT